MKTEVQISNETVRDKKNLSKADSNHVVTFSASMI